MKTREKIFNKKIKILLFLITLIVIVLLVRFAYAKYMTQLNGDASADIAHFYFNVKAGSSDNLIIDLGKTRKGVPQVANVQEGYVGPGTAGKFDIIINATNSETSLEYEINMDVDYQNNNVFPKNLIFYYDEGMKNAIYHNDNKISINGYIPYSESNKVHTKTIYWRWDYETGQTQDEKDANDIADSEWMGKDITLLVNVIGKQVNTNPTINQCAVTFDANGGIMKGYGNSENITKIILDGEYGELPVPTKEGYIFEGWTIKNLFELKDPVDYIYYQTPYQVDFSNNSISISGYETLEYTFIEIDLPTLKANTWYTISGDISLENLGNIMWLRISDKRGVTSGNTWILNRSVLSGHFSEKFLVDDTEKNTATMLLYACHGERNINAKATYSNIKIEEGTKETPYNINNIEPSTLLLQETNHTLVAKWRKD